MKCKNCSNEMKLGYIQSRNIICWCEKPSLVAAIPQLVRNRIYLTPEMSGALKGDVVEAYLCDKCREVVIKY